MTVDRPGVVLVLGCLVPAVRKKGYRAMVVCGSGVYKQNDRGIGGDSLMDLLMPMTGW